MTDAVMSIPEQLAYIQNKAQELDPGGPAGRALWCIDALCDLAGRLHARVESLEEYVESLDARADGVGRSIERAIEDHVAREWHR